MSVENDNIKNAGQLLLDTVKSNAMWYRRDLNDSIKSWKYSMFYNDKEHEVFLEWLDYCIGLNQ